jgi:hypothetical protein
VAGLSLDSSQAPGAGDIGLLLDSTQDGISNVVIQSSTSIGGFDRTIVYLTGTQQPSRIVYCIDEDPNPPRECR